VFFCIAGEAVRHRPGVPELGAGSLHVRADPDVAPGSGANWKAGRRSLRAHPTIAVRPGAV
jgi:hypothetical protein